MRSRQTQKTNIGEKTKDVNTSNTLGVMPSRIHSREDRGCLEFYKTILERRERRILMNYPAASGRSIK